MLDAALRFACSSSILGKSTSYRSKIRDRLCVVQSLDMKNLVCLAVSALALLPSIARAQVAPPACPTATGAYYLKGVDWAPMEPTHSIGFKTTNVMGAAFSYGAAKARVKAQFRDAASPYQLDGSVLTMCLVGVTDSGRDVTVAKFQEEKTHRELSMASMRLWTGINAQIDPASLIVTSVEKKGDKVYLVTSKDPLPKGEFILFTIVPDVAAMTKSNTPQALGGYDFGSHAR